MFPSEAYMEIGVVTKNKESWCSKKIIESFKNKNIKVFSFSLPELAARVGFKPEAKVKGVDLKTLNGILVRPIGPGSLDEIIFRIDVLHRISRLGVQITNSPSAIERAADKYFTLTLLEDASIPVPKTVVTESVSEAVTAFSDLGGDVIVKPIFGSRGLGITRVADSEIASRIFRLLNFNHFVLYIQEFIPHGNRDIRSFVIGDRIVASMFRASGSWKTNVSQGATPIPFKPSKEIQELAVRTAKTIGCEIAGVDIMENRNGFVVHEINSQPGFRGLQASSGVDIADEIAEYIIRKAKK